MFHVKHSLFCKKNFRAQTGNPRAKNSRRRQFGKSRREAPDKARLGNKPFFNKVGGGQGSNAQKTCRVRAKIMQKNMQV